MFLKPQYIKGDLGQKSRPNIGHITPIKIRKGFAKCLCVLKKVQHRTQPAGALLLGG